MTVTIETTDVTRARKAQLTLPVDSTIGHVRPRFVESLSLSDEEFDGTPVTWALYNESADGSPMVSDLDRVGDVLQDNHRVSVVPNNLTAGR